MHERTIGKGEDAQLLHLRAHTGGKFERGVLHPRTAEQTEAAMDRREEVEDAATPYQLSLSPARARSTWHTWLAISVSR